MLRQRILTALVLVAVLLPALFAEHPLPFGLLALLMVGAAGWEWGRLNGLAQASALLLGAAVALSSAAAWRAGWDATAPAGLWWAITLAWVIGGAWALRSGPSAWPALPAGLRLALGWLMLCAAWLALTAARGRGLGFILSALCVVWMADIAAYFGGRRFGRRKLAPSISPGKSWEGVVSGVLGVGLLALLWLAAEARWPAIGSSVFSQLELRTGLAGLALGVVLLCALSVAGDLVESLVKRAVGAKDSSGLLPGHGGVLDRIDALLPVLPAVMALAAL